MRIENGNISFAPAYDLLSTKLAMLEDNKQMALTINGKKNRLKKHDFDKLVAYLAINPVTSQRIFKN